MSDRNKIAQELTVDELSEFVAELAALPGKERTLEAIKGKAKERGIEISLMSAKSFRDTTFERHLARMRTAQDVASQVEGIEAGGNTLANASAKLLARRIFNDLLEADENETDVDIDALTLSVSRLRQGDVRKDEAGRRQAETDARLREFERREREREEKKAALSKTLDKEVKRGGITAETRKLIDQELGAIA